MLLLFWFFRFFCWPSGTLVHSINHCHIVPNGKVQNASLFGLFVLSAIASSLCRRRLRLWRRHGPSNQTDTWTKRRHRSVVARAYQSVCASAHTKVSASQGNFPTTHLRRHTSTTALDPPVKKPLCVCLTTRASVVNGSIAILSALRTCESLVIANLGRVLKTFFSRRHSIDTVTIAVSLDVLDARVQGNLLRECEQKFADLPEHLHLTKLCSNAGLAKTVQKVLYFTILDDTELDRLKGSCREYILSRSHQSSQERGWIRGNTKIESVLDVMVGCHQGRYGVEVMIETLFGDKTCSEMSDETHVESIGEKSARELVAKARPRQTSNSTLSLLFFSVSWTNVDRRGKFDDQIAATWWLSKSRRGRSSKIRRSGINISIKNYVFFVLVKFELD